jgi:hypothetical protein
MSNFHKPIKIVIEMTDEVVDFYEFVKRVLEDEDPKEENKEVDNS